MTDFLVNTPSHSEWVLPDRKHVMSSTISGGSMRWAIYPRHDKSSPKQSGYIDITKDNWEDVWELCQKLANKRYPRDPLTEKRHGH